MTATLLDQLPTWVDRADLVTNAELGHPVGPPDEPVNVGGRPLFRYDHDKAKRLIERVGELGGRARVSIDLACMHTPQLKRPEVLRVHDYGYKVTADPTLPPDTVIAIEAEAE